MRLSLPSTSLTAAASYAAFFSNWSNSVVASIIDLSYDSNINPWEEDSSRSLNTECSFAISPQLRGYATDAGILGCTEPGYICVEDERSSLGGRCTFSAVVHRALQNTPACTTKCTGT